MVGPQVVRRSQATILVLSGFSGGLKYCQWDLWFSEIRSVGFWWSEMWFLGSSWLGVGLVGLLSTRLGGLV